MRLSWLALLAPAILVLAGGTLIAAHAGDGATRITACARLNDGRLRVSPPDVSCRHNERALGWNVQGEPGPVGATGPAGPPGAPGPGLYSLEDLDGLACNAAGEAGIVAVTYDAVRHAVITCSGAAAGGLRRSLSTSSRPA